MRANVLRPWLALALALATHACALTGYDFGDYERAGSAVANQAGASGAGEPSAGGEPPSAGPFSVGLSAGATTGGAAAEATSETAGAAGAECEPQTCFALGLECGLAAPGLQDEQDEQDEKDGCGAGQVLDCGGCFWWFQECRQNICVIPE